MESMIKRDCERKDASTAVPGFGGVLDVIDSLIFAGPVAYGALAVDGPVSAPEPSSRIRYSAEIFCLSAVEKRRRWL